MENSRSRFERAGLSIAFPCRPCSLAGTRSRYFRPLPMTSSTKFGMPNDFPPCAENLLAHLNVAAAAHPARQQFARVYAALLGAFRQRFLDNIRHVERVSALHWRIVDQRLEVRVHDFAQRGELPGTLLQQVAVRIDR